MKWFVPVLLALVLLQSGFDKRGSFDDERKGSFDLDKKGSFDLNATGGGGGTGEVIIISG
jgi:hypothetical protein